MTLSPLRPDRGCHTYVIREGWEGLVRGNAPSSKTVPSTPVAETPPSYSDANAPADALEGILASQPLTFGSGELFKYQVYDSLEDEDNTAAADETLEPDVNDHHGGKYIIRVGWDDVRGWLGEVSPRRPAPSPNRPGADLAALLPPSPGRNPHRDGTLGGLCVSPLPSSLVPVSASLTASLQSARRRAASSPRCT